MILLLRLLWGATKDDLDSVRRTFKLTALLLIIDAVCLMAILIGIAMLNKAIADPWISGVGLLWMTLTALAIFFFAGPWLDTMGALDLFNSDKKKLTKDKKELNEKGKLKTIEKAGSAIIDVLRLFFAIQGIIVGFLFSIPVWRFPAGIFILPILIASVLLLGYLTDKPLKFLGYLYYISLGAIFVVIAVMVITGLSGNTNFVDWIRANPLILVAAFAFITAAITKGKNKSFGFFAGVGGLALVVGIFLILYGVTPSSVVKKSSAEAATEERSNNKIYTLKLSGLRNENGPDTLKIGERLIITSNPAKPRPLGAMLITPDGKSGKYYEWAEGKPQNDRWNIGNTGVPKGFLVKLELPDGLTLNDITLKLVKNQMASTKKRYPATRTIQPQNQKIPKTKMEEGDLPRNLEIIS